MRQVVAVSLYFCVIPFSNLFALFFGGLECVGHSYAYVTYFVFYF
jgi:hypothetical protein